MLACIFLLSRNYLVVSGVLQTATEYVAASCLVMEFTLSASMIQCVTTEGVGRNLAWRVSVAGQLSNSTGNASYQRPIISYFTGDAAVIGGTGGWQVRCCV